MSDLGGRVPVAIWSGQFPLYGVMVKCHTLDNGQRIIEADSMAALLEAMAQPDAHRTAYDSRDDISRFCSWQTGGGV